jgi:uncharacterized membrane protein
MVQPKYSPQEALERIKLMMNYDSSKTLNENKKVIFEQSYVDPGAVGSAATLGAVGAYGGAIAGAAYGATAGSMVFPVVGTAIGALAGLGLGALANWAVSGDQGEDGFRKVMEACKAEGASKLVTKLSKAEVRSIAQKIEDAKGDWNDDEDAIVSALMEIPTVADLCAVDKKIAGGLAEFLDNLTDDPDEWKMFTRPLEGIIEDSEIILTPEEAEDSDGGKTTPPPNKTGGYKDCSGTYSFGCKSEAIRKIQGCLGLVTDGKFGPKTQSALKTKGFDSFTDADVDKICGTSKPEPAKDEFSTEVDAVNYDDFLNM